MSHHDYREEPNVRFSRDKTMVFFTSNLSGASYVFGEVKKAENPAAADVKDAAELGRQWKPQAPEHGK
jgi:oligogalacturonide lyase